MNVLLATGLSNFNRKVALSLHGENDITIIGNVKSEFLLEKMIIDSQPDVLLLTQVFSQEVPCEEVVFKIRSMFPQIRIVFISSFPSTSLFATLLSHGVYDIIGPIFKIEELKRLVLHPNAFGKMIH